MVGIYINPLYIGETRARWAKRLPGLQLLVGDVQTENLEVAANELKDSGAQLAEQLGLDRGIRWRIGRVLTGGWLAILGIGYGAFFEGTPALEAGIDSGIIGAAQGVICALIAIGFKRYRSRTVGDS